MYCVRKSSTRTDSDITNVSETSFWEIQCELNSKEREKGLVVSIGRFTNSWSNSRVSMWTGREDKNGGQGWCWYQWWNTNTESLCWLPQSTHSAECSPFCCKPRDAKVTEQTPTLVYDILPSTTGVFSYAIGSRKLSANEQFFCWCSNSSKFVTNNWNKTKRVIHSRQQSLHQHK